MEADRYSSKLLLDNSALLHTLYQLCWIGKCRGLPKKRQKKAAKANTETSIVVASSSSMMVFPANEAVQNATHNRRKRKASSSSEVSKAKKAASTTSTSTTNTRYNTQLLLASYITVHQCKHWTVCVFVHKIWNWIQWSYSNSSCAPGSL